MKMKMDRYTVQNLTRIGILAIAIYLIYITMPPRFFKIEFTEQTVNFLVFAGIMALCTAIPVMGLYIQDKQGEFG